MTWRDLFQIVCVQARKPSFWSDGTALLRIVSEDGLMEPAALPEIGSCYFGGSARQIEKGLGLDGDQFLYIGDHIYTDAALAKLNFKCASTHSCLLRVLHARKRIVRDAVAGCVRSVHAVAAKRCRQLV